MNYIIHNCQEINGLNQRGGRMLSIVDLIERETLSIQMAAYLTNAIYHGASFLCCALEGGVGKTALMGALLGLMPKEERIVTVENEAMVGKLHSSRLKKEANGVQTCYIVHEIGNGSWFGYLWGPAVLHFMAIKKHNQRVVSNIHADTYGQIMDQITSFGGKEQQLSAFDLILFISMVDGKNGFFNQKRAVSQVLESKEGTGFKGFNQIFTYNDGNYEKINNGRYEAEKSTFYAIETSLRKMQRKGVRQIKEVMGEVNTLYQTF